MLFVVLFVAALFAVPLAADFHRNGSENILDSAGREIADAEIVKKVRSGLAIPSLQPQTLAHRQLGSIAVFLIGAADAIVIRWLPSLIRLVVLLIRAAVAFLF